MGRPAAAMRMGFDPSALNRKVKPGTAGRAMAYAKPYIGTLLLFLLVVMANASIAVANPLIYREIVNVGILTGNTTLIVQLALLVGAIGIVDAALGLLQTYMAARIGAEVVMSLRSPVVQPCAADAHRLLRPHPDRRAGEPTGHRCRPARAVPSPRCCPPWSATPSP